MKKYNDFVLDVIKESTAIETVEKVDKEMLDKIRFFYKKLKYSFNEIEDKLKRVPSTISIENQKILKSSKKPVTTSGTTLASVTTSGTTLAPVTTSGTTLAPVAPEKVVLTPDQKNKYQELLKNWQEEQRKNGKINLQPGQGTRQGLVNKAIAAFPKK